MLDTLKKLRKLDKWRREVGDLQNYLPGERWDLIDISLRNYNNFKAITKPDIGPISWSLIRNSLNQGEAVKKPFLRKGNGEKRLRYSKLTSAAEHYSSSVGSSWQKMVQKCAKIQRRALNVLKDWGTILEHYFKNLYGSLPRRVQVLWKNKGGHTKCWLLSLLELYTWYSHVCKRNNR